MQVAQGVHDVRGSGVDEHEEISLFVDILPYEADTAGGKCEGVEGELAGGGEDEERDVPVLLLAPRAPLPQLSMATVLASIGADCQWNDLVECLILSQEVHDELKFSFLIS